MAKMPWFRLYTEIRTDPKMQALSDLEFRAWLNILCLSAESKVRGVICIEEGLAYPVEGLARALFISIEELTSCFNKFQKLRMIDVDQDGIIAVIHFDDRQYEKPSDKPEEVLKRVRKHRVTKSNADVTQAKRQRNDTDTDTDTDTELVINNNINARESEIGSEKVETEPVDLTVDMDASLDHPKAIGTNSVNWAEKNWGRPIPKGEVDSIIAWCDEFSAKGSAEPDSVVIEGLRCCLEAGVRNMNYLRGVLTDWRESGVLTVDHVKTREAERKSQKDHKRNKDPVSKTPSTKYDNFYL